jgi:membrane-associated HD superfamily phosphohydrolase
MKIRESDKEILISISCMAALFMGFWLEIKLPVVESFINATFFVGPLLLYQTVGHRRQLIGATIVASICYAAWQSKWQLLLIYAGFYTVIISFVFFLRVINRR